jgi:hypothetical protein
MKNNLVEWEKHYVDILTKYYEQFCAIFILNKEEPPEYKDFVIYCYKNTKKSIFSLPGFNEKELRAPLIL